MILAEARPAYDYQVKPEQRPTPKTVASAGRAVRKHAAVSSKTRYVVFWLLAVMLALGIASRFAVGAKMNIDIAALDKQLAEVQTENEQLQLQIAELKSLARVEAAATTRLGMVRPTETRALVTGNQTATTAMVAADVGNNTKTDGGWIASVQRWLTNLIHTGRAEAKGL